MSTSGKPAAVAADGSGPDRDGSGWPSLHEYGLIGNQHTAALVSRAGSVDWACFPRFDSPSVFARLLDRRHGGYHAIRPTEPFTSSQEYVESTNLLTTRFSLAGDRVLTLTDFMPFELHARSPEGDPRIIRQMASRGGTIPVEIVAEPRFDYARQDVAWAFDGSVAVADAPSGDRLAFTSPWRWHPGDGPARVSRGHIEVGSALYAQVCWDEVPQEEPGPASLLAATDAYWRGWVSAETAPLRKVAARRLEWVVRSELTLKLLSHAGSGVFVAAPTTSLPEWPGGPRNWDYRFVWLRDAAFTAQVFLLLGHVAEARSYVAWALARVGAEGSNGDLRTLYAIHGEAPPSETDLPHLEGYMGSRPVRIGNAAAEQTQLDIYGEVLDSAASLAAVDPGFVRDHWETLERLADRTAQRWTEPDSGIWEIRGPPAHYLHSKLMCWVALDRAVRLASMFGRTEAAARWIPAATAVREAILTQGYDERARSFVQAFDRRRADASTLRVALVGLLPADDPRVLGTLEAVETTLSRGPFVYRYVGDDGIQGPEGAFLLCSFWLVEALARSGQITKASEKWAGLLEAGSPLKLFSEEFDPDERRPLGNFPQAFTHIGVLRAALALGLVE